MSQAQFIQGQWHPGAGDPLNSTNPATQQPFWQGRTASTSQVHAAVTAAKFTFPAWRTTPLSTRINLLQQFATLVKQHRDAFAQTISTETGKPRWEALTEVDAVANKIPISIDAYHEHCAPTTEDRDGSRQIRRFAPQGPCAVLGPFNFPAHLPNGHIVPALLAGNTIIFKPSEATPAVGAHLISLLAQADFPPGVINLVQGSRDTGQALASHPDLAGLFFTGSTSAGIALIKLLADTPGKILALEMGGNNPLVIWSVKSPAAAAYHAALSAFITAGQRCTCARRLILPVGPEGDAVIGELTRLIPRIRVGPPTASPEPFMGPLISIAAADRVLAAQQERLAKGATSILPMQLLDLSPPHRSAFLSPGLIDITHLSEKPDLEIFGPLLQIIRVPDFQFAINEANHTRYGLAAALFSDDRTLWDHFQSQIHAGVINWNRQTTNASSRLPFGGLGFSGNHRPAGAFSTDYASHPVAILEVDHLSLPEKPTPGIEIDHPMR